jgi:hypothetical protein
MEVVNPMKVLSQSSSRLKLLSFGKSPSQYLGKKLLLLEVSLLVSFPPHGPNISNIANFQFFCLFPVTAVQALYLRHKFNEPNNPSKENIPVLVWGGTSSVGLCELHPSSWFRDKRS